MDTCQTESCPLGNCNEIQDLLSSYIDEELFPEELAKVSAHLAQCPDCMKEAALLRETVVKVKTLSQPGLPPNFHKKLMKSIRVYNAREHPAKVPWLLSWKLSQWKHFVPEGYPETEPVFAKRKKLSVRQYSAMAAGVLVMFTVLSVAFAGLSQINQKSSGLSANQGTFYYGTTETATGGGQPLSASGAAQPEAAALEPEMVWLPDEAPETMKEFNSTAAETSISSNDRMLQDQSLILEGGAATIGSSRSDGELLVKSYHINLWVEDFELALSVIENLPGYNTWSEITDNRGASWARVTRRVDVESYDVVKEILQSLGKVTSANESLERITSDNLDIEARFAAKQEEAARLLELLGSSKTIDVLTLVESRLGQVEDEMDWLQGRLNFYADQGGSPQLNITLQARSETVPEKDGFVERVRKAYASSVNGTVRFMEVFLVMLSVISVPMVIFILLLICFWFIFIKKRTQR